MRRLPLLSVVVCVVLLMGSLGVPAYGSPPDTSSSRTGNNYQVTHHKNGDCFPLTTLLTGTIRGYDGKAVNAFIGMDLQDRTGTAIDGGGCSGAQRDLSTTYGVTVHVNYQTPSSGVDPSTPGVTTTWSASVPSNVAKIYFEVSPKGRSSRSDIGITDQTYYGNSTRPAVPITQSTQTISTLNLPLNACGNLSTGTVSGSATKDGKPVNITYVSAFSQGGIGSGTPAGNGPFGYNNVRYGGGGVRVYSLSKLASGHGRGQSYTLIADYTDGNLDADGNYVEHSKQFYMYDSHGVQHAGVFACNTTNFNLVF